MSLLRTLESKIEGLVEGTFGRIFRSEVRPIELARKLVKEMDEHRTPSVSRVYAPHEYDLWLSPADRDHYEGIESEVIDELCAYLLEHARREQLVLGARPVIRLHTDHDLELGEFGIQTHPVRLDAEEPERRARDRAAHGEEAGSWSRDVFTATASAHPEPEEAAGRTIIQRAGQASAAAAPPSARQSAGALLLVAGRRLVLPASGAVLGRSRECDVVLDDSGISRRHAQIRPRGEGWTIADLGSTNGVRLNGRRVEGEASLRGGDRVELGSTEIVFELR
jgi:predicted component of type VI protein secretion system